MFYYGLHIEIIILSDGHKAVQQKKIICTAPAHSTTLIAHLDKILKTGFAKEEAKLVIQFRFSEKATKFKKKISQYI